MAERAVDMRRRVPGAPAAHEPGRTALAHSEPGRPNPYPHRLSVDVDDTTYRALRLLAAEEGCTIVELVRSGIARELEERGGACRRHAQPRLDPPVATSSSTSWATSS